MREGVRRAQFRHAHNVLMTEGAAGVTGELYREQVKRRRALSALLAAALPTLHKHDPVLAREVEAAVPLDHLAIGENSGR